MDQFAMTFQPPRSMASKPATAATHAPGAFPTNTVPNMAQNLQMTITGFHEFLVGRLQYLSQETQWSLISTLSQRGWPLHLRSLASASWQLVPGAPWAPGDRETLMVLAAHGVRIEDIAQVFFEGRTAGECRDEIDAMKAGVPLTSIEPPGQQPEIDTELSKATSSKTTSSKVMSPAPFGTPSATTPFKNRLIEVSSSVSRPRPDTPYKDSRKDWDQADRDTVWTAVQRGLTPRQIQAQYLPFRSESAIQTRMTKERAIRGMQAAPTKWSNSDNDLILKLTSEGHDFEDIAPRLSRERTPRQIEARYSILKKQAEVSQKIPELNLTKDDEYEDEDTEMEDQNMQVDANGDDDSDYTEGTAQAVQRTSKPRTARKTVSSKSAPKAHPEKITPPSIARIRTQLLNSIDTRFLSSEDKKELRAVLNKRGWPSHFVSVEEYNYPLPKTGTRWTEQDTLALGSIREVVPSMPYRLICNFFPGRSEVSVRNQYNTKIGRWRKT